jgi:outer membrane protein insertion porin family
LTVPTFLPEQYGIKAALFSDFGVLGGLDSTDKAQNGQLVDPTQPTLGRVDIRDNYALRASGGVSVFWRSPMGPIRFDFSQVLAKQDYDKTELFRFSTGTRF